MSLVEFVFKQLSQCGNWYYGQYGGHRVKIDGGQLIELGNKYSLLYCNYFSGSKKLKLVLGEECCL